MYQILRYTDEVDKSLGVAGMTIALMACDGENCIAAVSVEDGEDTVEFTPEAFFACNPRFSAKIAWKQLMREFQIYSGMLMGNVMCRHLAAEKDIRQEMLDILHDLVAEQGVAKCELDQDELDDIFNKDLRYFSRLFSHPGVIDAARDFANNLRIQRRMTAGEVFDCLSRLSSGL